MKKGTVESDSETIGRDVEVRDRRVKPTIMDQEKSRKVDEQTRRKKIKEKD